MIEKYKNYNDIQIENELFDELIKIIDEKNFTTKEALNYVFQVYLESIKNEQ